MNKYQKTIELARLIQQADEQLAVLHEAVFRNGRDIEDWLIEAEENGISPRELREAGVTTPEQTLRNRRARGKQRHELAQLEEAERFSHRRNN